MDPFWPADSDRSDRGLWHVCNCRFQSSRLARQYNHTVINVVQHNSSKNDSARHAGLPVRRSCVIGDPTLKSSSKLQV